MFRRNIVFAAFRTLAFPPKFELPLIRTGFCQLHVQQANTASLLHYMPSGSRLRFSLRPRDWRDSSGDGDGRSTRRPATLKWSPDGERNQEGQGVRREPRAGATSGRISAEAFDGAHRYKCQEASPGEEFRRGRFVYRMSVNVRGADHSRRKVAFLWFDSTSVTDSSGAHSLMGCPGSRLRNLDRRGGGRRLVTGRLVVSNFKILAAGGTG